MKNKLVKLSILTLITSMTLIGCSSVKSVKPKFTEFSNEVSQLEFLKYVVTDSMFDKYNKQVKFDDNKNLTSDFVYTVNSSVTKSLTGKDKDGLEITFKEGSSNTIKYSYDKGTNTSLEEANAATESSAEGVMNAYYQYEGNDIFDIEYVSEPGYENELESIKGTLIRTQASDDQKYIYSINQKTKTYTKNQFVFTHNSQTLDQYFMSEVIENMTHSAYTSIPLTDFGLTYKCYADNDASVLTIHGVAKGSKTNSEQLFTEYDIDLTYQIDFKRLFFGFSKEVVIKQKGNKENVKYVENAYQISQIDFKNTSVVKANLDSFTLV